MGRKPWETPVEYNEDRFDDESSGPGYSDEEDISNAFELPDDDDGPFDDDDDDDEDFDSLDDEPIDYGQGPHDEEFGEDDGDESED